MALTDVESALVEAVAMTPLFNLRGCARAETVAQATEYLRRSIVPTCHGWGGQEWSGMTRPKGYWLRHHHDARGSVVLESTRGWLVSWRELASAARQAWDPPLLELYDRTRDLALRLPDDGDPDVLRRFERKIHEADRHVHDTLIARTAVRPGQLTMEIPE